MIREWFREKGAPILWLWLAFALIGAEVGTAYAHADPDQDATFLKLAAQHGMTWVSADAAINQGHAVCHELYAGKPLLDVANDAYIYTRLTSTEAAETFVAISIVSFCSEFSSGHGELA